MKHVFEWHSLDTVCDSYTIGMRASIKFVFRFIGNSEYNWAFCSYIYGTLYVLWTFGSSLITLLDSNVGIQFLWRVLLIQNILYCSYILNDKLFFNYRIYVWITNVLFSPHISISIMIMLVPILSLAPFLGAFMVFLFILLGMQLEIGSISW